MKTSGTGLKLLKAEHRIVNTMNVVLLSIYDVPKDTTHSISINHLEISYQKGMKAKYESKSNQFSNKMEEIIFRIPIGKI